MGRLTGRLHDGLFGGLTGRLSGRLWRANNVLFYGGGVSHERGQ